MIERNHKSKTLRVARQLRFEPLESRVQFAVDYLALEPEAWLHQAPIAFAIEDFASDYSSDYSSHWPIESELVLENESAQAFVFGSLEVDSPLLAYDTNLDSSWLWGPAIATTGSNPHVTSDLLVDSGIYPVTGDIFGVSEGILTGIGLYPSAPFVGPFDGLADDFQFAMEPVDVTGGSELPLPTDSVAWEPLASLDQAQDLAIGQAFAGDETFWWGFTDSQLAPSPFTEYIITDPWSSSVFFTATLLRSGPIVDVPDSVDAIFDSRFIIGLGSSTTPARPLPTTFAASQDLISMISLTAAVSPGLQSPPLRELGGPSGLRLIAGLEVPGIANLEAQPVNAQNSKLPGGTASRIVQPWQYLPLTAMANRLPIDIDLGPQLPVDGTAIVPHRSTSRGKAIPSAMVTDSVDAIAKVASTGMVKTILPTGMLPIGGEIGHQAVKIAQSHIANEHFVVQSLLICDFLRDFEPEEDMPRSPTGDESLADASLPKPSLSILLVGCLIAALQTALRPRTLMDSKLLGWFVVR